MLETILNTFHDISPNFLDGLGYRDFSLLVGFSFWLIGLMVPIHSVDKADYYTAWMYVGFFMLSATIQLIALPQEHQQFLKTSNIVLAMIAIFLFTWARWFRAKKHAIARVKKNGEK